MVMQCRDWSLNLMRMHPLKCNLWQRRSWLLKDGSLFQFKREYLRQAEPLRNIVSCVKTHPVSFFGGEGERQLRLLEIGERSVAFLPRPTRESQKRFALRETDRQVVSWYVRVRQANQHDANH